MTQPVKDPNRGWKMWYENEIYTGPTGAGRYVPNVEDAVWSWSGPLRCVSVDYTTGLSTLVAHSFQNMTGGVVQEDVLLGAVPSTMNDLYRIYINTTRLPHDLACDHRLHLYGTDAAYCKIFRGTDISITGTVVSAVYNASGVFVSENIPLDIVSPPATKAPRLACASESLTDGEAVTLVVYATNGAVLSACKLIVKQTNFVRTLDQSQKYVASIELLSAYLSLSDNRVLEYPANMLLQSSALIGRVWYTDGSHRDYQVGGGKFELYGMNAYLTSVVGQTADLTLTYFLSTGESVNGAGDVAPNRSVSKSYQVKTVQSDGLYSVKIFAVPRWLASPLSRWVLDYYLYNIERTVMYDVTAYVTPSTAATQFDGTDYVTTQTVTAGMNLQDIPNSGYGSYRHVQSFKIRLYDAGAVGQSQIYHAIRYSDNLVVGDHLNCTIDSDVNNVGAKRILVANGRVTVADWLATCYTPIQALYRTPGETQAPVPTHARLRVGTWQRVVSIADLLNPVVNVTVNTTGLQGQPCRLEFLHVSPQRTLELGVLGLTISVV